MPRHALCVQVFVILCVAGCRASSPSIPVVDFIKTFSRAEKRPPEGYALSLRATAGVFRPSIEGPSPGRVIWQLRLPRHGLFRSAVTTDGSAAVRFRVGISDDRIYEELARVTVPAGGQPGWTALHADLSAYAGWKWSLFYRPDRVSWRVILSADAVEGVPGRAIWGAPEVMTDPSGAREYVKRLER
jgi:hypothetical protein